MFSQSLVSFVSMLRYHLILIGLFGGANHYLLKHWLNIIPAPPRGGCFLEPYRTGDSTEER